MQVSINYGVFSVFRAYFSIGVLMLNTFFSMSVFGQRMHSFDRGWERYSIEMANTPSGRKPVRQGTSFISQFNDEHLKAAEPDSSEVQEALRGYAKELPAIASLSWTPVILPCPARDEERLNPGKDQFVGICYYRKRFRIPAEEREYSLRFDGVMQVASVWINGRFVLQHQGGYLPFIVRLNPYVHPGDTCEIVVRADNRNNPNTPPGKPIERLGFLYWSGIYRNVWLIATGNIHITDPLQEKGGVCVRYEHVSADAATLAVRTQVMGSGRRLTVRQVLEDCKGRTFAVSTSRTFNLKETQPDTVMQRLSVYRPHLWSPDDPFLYVLHTEVLRGDRVVDKMSQRIGIRSLSFTRSNGFVLNGRPLRIIGTNRHQDHPYIGNAIAAPEQYRDLVRIKEAGMNFVRLAHYPQDPSVFDICDSLGLMVADPIAGWQFFNNNATFKSRVFRDIRETIRRDQNHPCVILWEMSLNESYPPDSFRIASARIAHAEYQGDYFFTSGDTYAAKHTDWDVPYNGWTDPFGRPQDVEPEKPGLVREYGHYEFGGGQSTTNANRSNGEHALLQNAWNLQWEHNLLRGADYYPWTIGDASWAFYDGFEAYIHATTDWGIMDVFRLPKFSYYFFKSQRDSPAMVFIANWWTAQDTSGRVVVYSNADSIALYRNGRHLETRTPDAGPGSPYGDWDHGGNPFDGGNARNLAHPPFTFNGITWERGSLLAVAYVGGHPVDSAVRRTPEEATALRLESDFVGIPLKADGADVIFVHAHLTDAYGTTEVLDNATKVAFTVNGEGTIVGPATVSARGGIATVMIRATGTAGKVNVRANAPNLAGGTWSTISR